METRRVYLPTGLAGILVVACSAGTALGQASTLWDSGPPKQVVFNGNLTFLGYSSGNLSAALPQRWAAHPFVVSGGPWVISQVDADWFIVAGAEAQNVNYVIFNWHPAGRDTAPNVPELVEQGVLGPYLVGTDDPEVPGAEDWLHVYPSCIELDVGNYYLTIYADVPVEGGTFTNAAWLCGADGGWEPGQVPGDGSAAANERDYMWRSAMFPSPGFLMYAPSNVQPDTASGQDTEDRWNCSFTLRGFVGAAGGDCDNDGTPDPCEPDCNGNMVPDDCDLIGGTSEDCNNNGLLDDCEIGFGQDCNHNGTMDLCESTYVDCNTNGVDDACDINPATANDTDANNNNVPDLCDGDCNTNDVGDPQDAVGATSEDVDADFGPDECQFDCNANGTPDSYEVAQGATDCNGDGQPDECDVPQTAGPADTCEAAGWITSNHTYQGSTYVGTPTGGGLDGCAESGDIRDHYYKYKPLADGLATLSMCSLPQASSYDAALMIYDTCPAVDPPLACDDDGCAPPNEVGYPSRIVDFAVTAGTTYIIRVTGFPNPEQGPHGDYELVLTGPAGAGDENANGVPDECEVTGCQSCVADMTGEGLVDGDDVPPMVMAVINGTNDPCADINGNGVVDMADVPLFVGFLLYGGNCGENVRAIPCIGCDGGDLYCIYTVNGVQGGGCGALPANGGTLCVLCDEGFPGGDCPDYTGVTWKHFDANGNVICTGTIAGYAPGGGIACTNCPPNNSLQVLAR